MLKAFAEQAAIAVANAKLFNDLDAALERQTAMTDVLDAVEHRGEPTSSPSTTLWPDTHCVSVMEPPWRSSSGRARISSAPQTTGPTSPSSTIWRRLASS